MALLVEHICPLSILPQIYFGQRSDFCRGETDLFWKHWKKISCWKDIEKWVLMRRRVLKILDIQTALRYFYEDEEIFSSDACAENIMMKRH